MRILRYISLLISCLLWVGCSKDVQIERHIGQLPPIWPDYTEVTLPPNIAPPSFSMPDSCQVSELRAICKAGNEEILIKARNGQISISPSQWKKLVSTSSPISVCLQARRGGKWEEYVPFHLYIAEEKIDPYIAYRLIEPGYETWNEMGIYQRCLENYEETAIITNKMTGYGCMNCHSFCQQNPDKMLFHLRSDYGGTYLIQEGQIQKLNTKTPQTISALVYPSWHPSGDFVAFSVNDTKQMFHTTDRNRVEVMDYKSDVVVYDVKREQIVSSPLLSSATAFETFPTFSPDGKTLYFCSADSVDIPAQYDQVRYSLCAINYDASTRSFGNRVDTLYNACQEGKSVSFPRVSPDGKFLMFTLSAYGNFSIWHKDADLYLTNLQTSETQPLSVLNSDDVDSYHSWSSNSRWVVFSSRRIDGLYTRPFIAYVDEAGKAHKPFLLLQKKTDYYDFLMKSYNIPEFISGKVNASAYEISRIAKEERGTDITYSPQ
ncbi:MULTISPECIES: hypothetical protein [unclassified Parabacteroides]|uniref:TolB family protein n=1 Tax=unclassified Parabacteroides TaxID=2649774 RepID=UPI0024732C14|nr:MULTISPECIES: hypothetical protein [unclassified Parabacteroides]